MERARETLRAIGFDNPDGEQILHELELAVLRSPSRLTETRNQSDLIRTMMELLVAAIEKVERDRALGDQFALAAEERQEDQQQFTRASTRAAARRWQG